MRMNCQKYVKVRGVVATCWSDGWPVGADGSLGCLRVGFGKQCCIRSVVHLYFMLFLDILLHNNWRIAPFGV